jgi:DNA-binding transcriptional regulator GbsR (MarR family)
LTSSSRKGVGILDSKLEVVVERVESAQREWSLVSSHGAVLLVVAARPNSTLRQIALAVGVTERQAARIIKDLTGAELLRMELRGRRNVYTVNEDAYFRRSLFAHIRLERLLSALLPEMETTPSNAG